MKQIHIIIILFGIIPFQNSILEGKVYKNVVLKIKKNKANTLYTNNKTESNNKRVDSVATIKVNKTETVSGKYLDENTFASIFRFKSRCSECFLPKKVALFTFFQPSFSP